MSDEENNTGQESYDEDIVKILLATDIHLGYERSTKRLQEKDSFITFEEILQHAQQQDVDLILLGGDLFHDSKPTQKVVQQCIEILKKYTLGERELQINFLSNPEVIFPHSFRKGVNFEDPNMNIAMPIFSIHGNHDNPSFETTGTMDVLGASGLINYFGKWPDLTNVTIPPLLFNKGKTYVSIYGLSYINDQRLSRLLRDEQLVLMRPAGTPEPFKILVVHQNRSKHTENGYIPENKLPACLDLIFWGHEHECRVEAEYIEDTTVCPPRSYYISQPGSSVATSLCQGEAKEKNIGLLKINKRRFKILPIKLKTVRPFVFEDLYLRTVDLKPDLKTAHSDVVCEHIDDYIEHILLPKAKKQLTDNPNQPKVPLIRLRIFYTQDAELFDVTKLSRKYADKVANPRDMIMFRKEKGSAEDDKKNVFDEENDADEDISECFRTDGDDDWSRTIQGGIRNYFAREDKKYDLKLLSVGGLNEALRSFVEASDDDAFKLVVDHQMKKAVEYLKKFDVTEEPQIIEQLKVYREERNKAEENGDEEREVKKFLTTEAGKNPKKLTQSRAAAAHDDSDAEDNDDVDDVVNDEDPPATRGRGRGSRGRARGARGSTTTVIGSTRGRGKAAAAKTALDVSAFFGANDSSLKPAKPSGGVSLLSQFRSKPATQSKKGHFIDESDSD